MEHRSSHCKRTYTREPLSREKERKRHKVSKYCDRYQAPDIEKKDGFGRGRGRARGRDRYRGGSRYQARFGEPDDRFAQHRPDERRHKMGYKRLQELRTSDPARALQSAASRSSGFHEILKSTVLGPDWVVAVLEILRKACSCSSAPQTQNELLSTVLNSPFVLTVLAMYYTQILVDKTQFPSEALKDSLLLLKTLLQKFPSSYHKLIPAISTIELFINRQLGAAGFVDSAIQRSLEEILAIRDGIFDKKTRPENNVDQEDQGDSQCPPDDFRTIPIFPKLEDVNLDEQPFLRRNKERGGYDHLDHYLDVQFRLLREDFVSPLRDGIHQYLAQKKGVSHGRLQDIRIYNNVQILYPQCSDSGINHRIRFDVSRLKKVRWQSSKRLIYGSLVCMSKDNFQTMVFASVANRNSQELEKGEIDVHIENNQELILQNHINDVYVMAETSAYFEAYRHVLKALQGIEENAFPFQEYVVHCNKDVQPPAYLRNQPRTYDLSPLHDEKARIVKFRKTLVDILQGDGSGSDEEYVPSSLGKLGVGCVTKVPVLDLHKWPSSETLHLDDSQMKAVQTALTKEFAIIQGPPGTGKTYVGLKLVKALLHNRAVWTEQCGESRGPILVVCYTNHALDQFLEDIHNFHKNDIVRVGGRCQSAELANCVISKLRMNLREAKTVPREIRAGVYEAREQLNTIKETLWKESSRLEATEKGILVENILETHMTDEQYESLTKIIPEDPWEYVHQRHFNPTAMTMWLGLENIVYLEPLEAEHHVHEEGEEQIDEGVDIMEEAELLAQQRMLDDSQPQRRGRNDDAQRQQVLQNVMKEDLAVNFDELNIDDASGAQNPGWQFQQREHKHRKKKLARELSNRDIMREDEALLVENVWALSEKNRWRLYRYWLSKHQEYIQNRLRGYVLQYQEAAVRLQEVRDQEDLIIMRRAAVVGMTTTGAARYRNILQEIRPRIIVVEEAAEVLEAHIIASLSAGCQHLILIGDHKQLRPNPTVYDLAKEYKLDISLFERMVNNGMNCDTLVLQHRMRPRISSILHTIYDNLQDHESVMGYEDVRGISSNVYFIDHTQPEVTNEEMRSHLNEHEAKYIARLARYLILQGYNPSQITVLTMYTGQLFCLKKLMPKDQFEGVRVSAVDNFQGEENDIVLLSLVRSNRDGKIGFLGISNRICVALSRAKMGFYVIGNFALLSEKNSLWNRIVNIARGGNIIGPSLSLYCENHKDERIDAFTDKDFDKAPEGGCTKPCEFRLPCGHVCMRSCHNNDVEHTEYKCLKSCMKALCDKGHRCKKPCFKDCGKCTTPVDKVIPRCGHKQKVPCWQLPSMFKCQEPCALQLICGHMCPNKCGQGHAIQCSVPMEKTLSCGHGAEAFCYEKTSEITCKKKCKTPLSCGHQCGGTCGTCYRGRIHETCKSPCNRPLVCGHLCNEPCTKTCPPCSAKCENRCTHSRCEKKCGSPCASCMEPCSWICEHYQCSKLCHEPCDRPRCYEPCTKKLKCGHFCIGLCGERCPNKCRICNEDEVTEIFFGEEDNPEARFVQLVDCGHILEQEGLDRWMDMAEDTTEGRIDIQLKCCPKCKSPIRRNLRYGTILNNILTDIEIVKQRARGNASVIGEKKRTLRAKLYSISGDFLRSLRQDGIDPVAAKTLKDALDKSEITEEQITMVENQFNLLERMCKMKTTIKEKLALSKQMEMPKKADDLLAELDDLQVWLLKPRNRLSEQTLTGITFELSRLAILTSMYMLEFKVEQIDFKLQPVDLDTWTRLKRTLTDGQPLTDARERDCKKMIEHLKSVIPSSCLGISDEERVDIIKAIGLTQGHWYKCPKGHVYAIGECGGANQEGRCPECGSVIGGQSHRLADGNAVASEMDGARHAAWSEEANLQNYELVHLM